MPRAIRRPDFFLVGAPKCGTTAMHVGLGQHPDVFVPDAKETNHFASDLLPERDPYRSRERFLALFRRAGEQRRVGESSVFHLYSREAARNIREFAPEARILVMLRDPVDWLASYHSQMLYNGDEDIPELECALEVEAARRRGERLPANLRFPERLFYRDVGRFAEQLERYFAAFGREAVHVVLYDDLRHDPAKTFRDTFAFLGVDAGFEPAPGVVNPNKEVRSAALSEFLRRPPDWAAALVTRVLPRATRTALRVRVRRLNARVRERRPPSPALRGRLARELRPEVERLAALLGRDLDAWGRPEAEAVAGRDANGA